MNSPLMLKSLILMLLGAVMFAYFSRIAHPTTPPQLVQACMSKLSENQPPSAELSESLKQCEKNSVALTVTTKSIDDAAHKVSALMTNRFIFTTLTVVSALVFLIGLSLLLLGFKKSNRPKGLS